MQNTPHSSGSERLPEIQEQCDSIMEEYVGMSIESQAKIFDTILSYLEVSLGGNVQLQQISRKRKMLAVDISSPELAEKERAFFERVKQLFSRLRADGKIKMISNLRICLKRSIQGNRQRIQSVMGNSAATSSAGFQIKGKVEASPSMMRELRDANAARTEPTRVSWGTDETLLFQPSNQKHEEPDTLEMEKSSIKDVNEPATQEDWWNQPLPTGSVKSTPSSGNKPAKGGNVQQMIREQGLNPYGPRENKKH